MTPDPIHAVDRPGFTQRLAFRLSFWIIGTTGLILAAVIIWNFVSLRRHVETVARDQARGQAEAAAWQIDRQLSAIASLVEGVALGLEVQSLQLSYPELRRLQVRLLSEHPELTGTTVALHPDFVNDWPQPSSRVYRQDKEIDFQPLTDKSRAYMMEDWFSLPQYLGHSVWSEPYRGKTGVKMVTYSVPIHLSSAGDKRFAGVVTGQVDIDWLDNLLRLLSVGENGYGLLMTHNGTYIAHPLAHVPLRESIFSIADERSDPFLRQVGQQMVSGQSGLLPWVSWAGQEASWLAWQPLEATNWTVATLVSQAPLRAEILKLSHHQALLGGGGLLLLLLAVAGVTRSITRPIAALNLAAGTLAAGDLEAALPQPRGKDEVARLTLAFGSMRDNLKHYIADLAATTAARERINGELQAARDIQMDLIPKTFPAFPQREDLDLFAVMEPAREVGGDFYDFFMLDDKKLVITIGDVSGKGVPAALFMAVTRSLLRSEFRVETDPAKALAWVNDELAANNDACMFVTLFSAVVDLSNGAVRFANAGHNPPLLISDTGKLTWIHEPFGAAAGALEGMTYETGRFDLAAGASLLLYTDGVTEAMNHADELYDNPRLAACMSSAAGKSSKTSLMMLMEDLRAHVQGAEQSDDITMLMLRLHNSGCSEKITSSANIAEKTMIIRNRLAEIGRLAEQIEAWTEQEKIPPRTVQQLNLVLDELITNVISYGYTDSVEHQIEISLRHQPGCFVTRIKDDGHPFNPLTEAPEVNLDLPLEEREIGGLGLHFLRTMINEVDYHYQNGLNCLTLTQFYDRDVEKTDRP